MTAITVANTDWSIVEAVRLALADATVAGDRVFESVSVTTSAAQAGQCQFQTSPVAVVRYVTTQEAASPEDVRGCRVELELILAAQADCDGVDESPRLEAALRLKNAAVNAVEAAPPAEAHAWGGRDHYQHRLHWGRPAIDASADQPWAVCRLPLEVSFILDSGTSH